MIDKEFALGSYEINLQTAEERRIILNKMSTVCKYIDTAIDYDNDYLFKDEKQYKIISKISSFHNNDYEFFVSNHLRCLGRDQVDIMLIHSNRGNWEPIALKIVNDPRFKETGVSNFTVDDMIRYKKLTGSYPKYNELEINPYYADLEAIKFCQQNGIKVIAYGILCGKYRATSIVAAYTLPGLVAFASKYADIIIMKPDSLRQTAEFIDAAKNYDINNMPPIDFIKIDDKSVEPMVYSAMPIEKQCLGKPSYSISCGCNSAQLKESLINITLPSMEMLGDYKTYVRYKYRQNYDGSAVYYYDFLIGDDKKYYAVYLYDENNHITKINKLNKVKLYCYEV